MSGRHKPSGSSVRRTLLKWVVISYFCCFRYSANVSTDCPVHFVLPKMHTNIGNILITSGPTREYLDPVRYLTNGSSGRMGLALAEAVLQQGGAPVVVSGQVAVSYPAETEVHWVETTEQMLQRCLELFPQCIGVIGAAAPCDFRPLSFSEQKITKPKDGSGITLRFSETPDILAALGKIKRPDQWSVAFALETENGKHRALEKLKQKCCDFVILNTPDAINRNEASFQIFDIAGQQRKTFTGPKCLFADKLLRFILQERREKNTF